ncbi:hypothetical protein D9M68_948900 [compost metagenome]
MAALRFGERSHPGVCKKGIENLQYGVGAGRPIYKPDLPVRKQYLDEYLKGKLFRERLAVIGNPRWIRPMFKREFSEFFRCVIVSEGLNRERVTADLANCFRKH